MILTFAGPIGSGKTSLSKRVAEKLGWRRASFGDYIRDLARRQNIEPTRDNLQQLGKEEIDGGWNNFCTNVMRAADWRAGQNLVVDGMRHLDAFDSITKIAAPSEVYLVYIRIDDKERLRRMQLRDDDVDLIEQHDCHFTERQVHSDIPQRADVIVDGNRSIDEMTHRILDFVAAWTRS